MHVDKFGCKRIYNREFANRGINDVILWDEFHVEDGEVIRVIFKSMNSEYRQGIWLKTDGGLEIEGEHFASVDLWYDTAPNEVICKCHTNNGCLCIYNIFIHSGHRMSQTASSGMRVIESEQVRTYFCNDVGFVTDFCKLVFCIKRLRH